MELMEDGTTIEQQMFAMATEKKVPLYGVLELLPLCNLNCDMCYVRMSREEMEEVGRLRTMEEWTKTAEDMMRAGTLFVLLTGGEPLLYPHFRELYQKLRELGMIITINTNGTLIDEAWADFFAENKPRRINITLYGASNETYERLCHYPGGFDKAVNGIRLLRERNIDVKVNGSLAKANVDDRMKIIELGESLDAPVRIDTYMYPSVRERNHAYNNQARLDPEMAAKARVEVLRREMGEEVFAQYRKIQLDEAENTPEGEAVPGQMTCRAGKSSFVVNWQGEMRSCVVLDKPSIPLRDVEFEEAWKFTKKEGKSTAISFLRDSLVDIDGHGKSRLGHTYAYGGVGLTINTINKTYDLDIQNYITISFDDLVNVIDEIGGVTVFISEEEAAYYRENGMPDIQAGDVTLTGSQALAHARNRTLGNDFERTRRQRSVMYGIYRKIMEKKDPSALLPLINYAVNHVRTNMSVSEMYSMAKDVLSVDDLKMQQTCIPQDGTYTDITYEGMQVLKVDFDANKKKIEQLLY